VSDDVNKKTQETATKLFGKGIKMDPPYLMWRQYDKDLANDFSRSSRETCTPGRC
jgi:hypothetical protein